MVLCMSAGTQVQCPQFRDQAAHARTQSFKMARISSCPWQPIFYHIRTIYGVLEEKTKAVITVCG